MTDLIVGEPNLFAFLTGLPAVTALVGNRVFNERIPQALPGSPQVFPCVCFFRASAIRGETFAASDNNVEGNYQVDVYATDPDVKKAIGRVIRKALLPYVGPMGDCTVNQIRLQTDFDQPPGLEPGLYRRTFLYQIWYWED